MEAERMDSRGLTDRSNARGATANHGRYPVERMMVRVEWARKRQYGWHRRTPSCPMKAQGFRDEAFFFARRQNRNC